MTLQERINAAQSLEELCGLLNSFEPAHEGDRLEDHVDLPGLPTFGGKMPADTSGIWSWNDVAFVYCDNGKFFPDPRGDL